MESDYKRFLEVFPESISARHKVSDKTEKETFHLHSQLEIIYSVSDNLKVRFEDSMICIPADHLLLLNSMNLHYILSEEGSGPCDRHVLFFSADVLSGVTTPEINLLECFLMKKDEHCGLLHVPLDSRQEVLAVLSEMEKCEMELRDLSQQMQEQESVSFAAAVDLRFRLLLGLFLLKVNELNRQQRGNECPHISTEDSTLVFRICDYIRSDYDEEISASSLARKFFVSKSKLYSLFHEVLGTTVNDYITNIRITRAKDLLINSRLSVEVISTEVGYGTISSFSRIFKARTGQSPLQYRKALAD